MKDEALTLEKFLSSEAADVVSKLPFERGLKLLEELVSKVESGTLPLEQAIQAYEKGAALVGKLRGQLSGAEEKLKVLKGGSASEGENGKRAK